MSVPARVRRLVPDGLSARLALLLAGALVAANLVALALLSSERDRLSREARLENAVTQIVGTVEIVEGLPPRRRERVLERRGGRGIDFAAGSRPTVQTSATNEETDLLRSFADRLRTELGDEREVRVSTRERSRPSGRRIGERFRERGWNRRELLLSIALNTTNGASAGERGASDASTNGVGVTRMAQWLNVRANALRPPPRLGGVSTLLIVQGLSLAAVLAVALLFVRRLTRPLRELATAARAAGRGDRSARVDERGARELREAASAFNDMQTRIARFDAERTRTLAAVGHDLRTPITSLRIRAEMLDDDAREPVVATLNEMRVMADGLVAYARGDGDGEAIEAVDLEALLARLCKERGATLVRSTDVHISGKPVAFTRAFGNLIDNAVRYGETARVALSTQGIEAIVTIEDDGPGIPEDAMDAMLEPFARGEASRSTETGGAGLGLAIARAVIRSHGGTLDLANRPNGGLRATVRLPGATA